jgi:hypothetical protein
MFRCTRYVRYPHQRASLTENPDNTTSHNYPAKSKNRTASIHGNQRGNTLEAGEGLHKIASGNDILFESIPVEKNHSDAASLRTVYGSLNAATSLESQLSNDNCRGRTLVSGE